MLTSKIRAEWQRRAAALINSAGVVDLISLRALLRYAAVNAPVADSANLFQLFDAAPGAEGTLVPSALAPAVMPRLDVTVRNPAYRRGAATASAAPAAPVLAALPEAVRETIREVANKADWAGNCLLEVTDEENKKREAVAVQETAAKLLALGNQADPNPAEVLAMLDEVSASLVQARQDNELADFVLGEDGNVTVQMLGQLQTDVRNFRDQTSARVAGPDPAQEWIEQQFVDVGSVIGKRERETLLKTRQDALVRSEAADETELSSALSMRFPDDDELAAAVQVAHSLIKQAASPDDMEVGITAINIHLPQGITQDRFAEILGAGLDTAMGRIKPVLRVANVAPGQEDFSARQVAGTVAVETELLVEAAPSIGAEAEASAPAMEPPVGTAPAVAAAEPVAQAPTEEADPVGFVVPPKVDPIEPRFQVGDEVEYKTAEGSWSRDKVKMVVPINRTVNGGVDAFLNDILGADAAQYHLETGEVVGGEGIRRARTNKIDPLSVPTPAYETVPETPAPAAKQDAPDQVEHMTPGEWIEYTDKSGETKVGQIEYIASTTDFVPGVNNIGRAPKRQEYCLYNGDSVGPDMKPRRVPMPALSACQVSAMFFSRIGWNDKGSEHRHSKLLFDCTPSEFEKSIGFDPKDVKENYAIARRLCVAFSAMDKEEQLSLRQSEQEGGERLQSWVGGMLHYWSEAKKEDAGIAASATGDLKASVERAQAADAANQQTARTKAEQAGYPVEGEEAPNEMGGKMPAFEESARAYAQRMVNGLLSGGRYSVEQAESEVGRNYIANGEAGYQIKGGNIQIPNWHGRSNGGQPWVFSVRELAESHPQARADGIAPLPSTGSKVQRAKNPADVPGDKDAARTYAKARVAEKLDRGYDSTKADAETMMGEGGPTTASFHISHGKLHVENEHVEEARRGWTFSFRELEKEILAERAVAQTDSALTEAPASVADDLDMPEVPELDAPDLGYVETVPVTRSEPEGVDPSEMHAGSYRVWFLAGAAKERVDGGNKPWQAVLSESVNRADYELVARVSGAHAVEVFYRLQNGFQDWADVNDPGATVSLNMNANDGRLRRRSMDFADMIEEIPPEGGQGKCYLVGCNAVHEVAAPAEGLKPQTAPKWQSVPVRQGFVDPIEELATAVAGEEPAKAGHGRRR